MTVEIVEKLEKIYHEYEKKRGVGLALFKEGEEYDDMYSYKWAVSLALSCVFYNPRKPNERELAAYDFLDKDVSYIRVNFCRTFVERRTNQAEHKLEINHTDIFLKEEEAAKINSSDDLIKELCLGNGRGYELITVEEAQLRFGKLIFDF